MNLNLEALGVTRESLTKAILSELNLSPEQAVLELAKELGVEVIKADDYKQPEPSTIKNGDVVTTDSGAAKAAILSPSELQTLADAGRILYGRLVA